MKTIHFSKWEGTGNDFILLDDRQPGFLPIDTGALARTLCDRHIGIGSDGLILIRPGTGVAFNMVFHNPDGSQSFCGNGSRCAFAFHSQLYGPGGPEATTSATFSAIDGMHTAEWQGDEVRISMLPVDGVRSLAVDMDLLHTGSPHLLIWVQDPDAIDIDPEARKYRYDPQFGPGGVNVNFVTRRAGGLYMRTYERGVEAETLSCGTGVTAAALDAMHRGVVNGACRVETRGGVLHVEARHIEGGRFEGIHLTGPVREVFRGEVNI